MILTHIKTILLSLLIVNSTNVSAMYRFQKCTSSSSFSTQSKLPPELKEFEIPLMNKQFWFNGIRYDAFSWSLNKFNYNQPNVVNVLKDMIRGYFTYDQRHGFTVQDQTNCKSALQALKATGQKFLIYNSGHKDLGGVRNLYGQALMALRKELSGDCYYSYLFSSNNSTYEQYPATNYQSSSDHTYDDLASKLSTLQIDSSTQSSYQYSSNNSTYEQYPATDYQGLSSSSNAKIYPYEQRSEKVFSRFFSQFNLNKNKQEQLQKIKEQALSLLNRYLPKKKHVESTTITQNHHITVIDSYALPELGNNTTYTNRLFNCRQTHFDKIYRLIHAIPHNTINSTSKLIVTGLECLGNPKKDTLFIALIFDTTTIDYASLTSFVFEINEIVSKNVFSNHEKSSPKSLLQDNTFNAHISLVEIKFKDKNTQEEFKTQFNNTLKNKFYDKLKQSGQPIEPIAITPKDDFRISLNAMCTYPKITINPFS